MTDLKSCPHDVVEQETALADGLCPLCLRDRAPDPEQKVQEQACDVDTPMRARIIALEREVERLTRANLKLVAMVESQRKDRAALVAAGDALDEWCVKDEAREVWRTLAHPQPDAGERR